MFLPYFNFKKNPFNLTIDSAYLYLGRQHEEAIAHLTYAVLEGEGFIVISGLRGVGKTIVCRSFLEGLDANVETAYIDRYTSNPQRLLLDINTEFKIHSDTNTIKDLADALNKFLIQKKIEGKQVVVFIDDAHNLNTEVLEQVRLISNLETTKDKLIQLVLIGEPQLSEMLHSNELRQIGQRVSVGYCIGPLTYDETFGYIQHRLTIASKGPPIKFDRKAVRRIFKYSGGIPREINLACSQALELAYRRQLKYIDGGIAKEAVKNLYERTRVEKPESRKRKLSGIFAAVCCLLFVITAAAYFFIYGNERYQSAKTGTEKSPETPGLTTRIPEVSETPTPVNPAPPVMEEDLSAEPFQDGRSRVAAEPVLPSHDNIGVEEKVPAQITHSVQVGAFQRMEHAEKLVTRLESKGYPARMVEMTDSQDRLWYTVLIGDYPTLEAAEEQARAFAQRENMKTFIRPYRASP